MKKMLPSKSPSVLYVCEWFLPIIGGAGQQALRQAKVLSKKYNILIATRLVYRAKSSETIDGLPIQRFGSAMFMKNAASQNSTLQDYLSGFMLFLYIIKNSHRYQLIHIHGNLENNFAAAAILAGRLLSIPIVAKLAIHGELLTHDENPNQKTLTTLRRSLNPLNHFRRYLARHCNHYIAISTTLLQELKNVGISDQNVSLIPNGINIAVINKNTPNRYTHPNPHPNQHPPTKKPSTTNFIVVSRLARHKGILDPLLTTWQRHYSQNPSVSLTIVGSGEGLSSSIESDIHTFVATHNLTNVHLVGHQPDPTSYYQQADICIFPSFNEGLSNSLLEAAAFGKICIGSNVSGTTDVLSDGQTGFLFDPHHPADLNKKISTALAMTPAQKSTMSAKLIAHIKQTYSLDHIASQLDALYSHLL